MPTPTHAPSRRGRKRGTTASTSPIVRGPDIDQPRPRVVPIVGIGASAGGFEAFSRLLQVLPSNTGMAFVFVQHLEPEHKSMLAKLFSKVTEMPVVEVRNGTAVQADHVYVIPPKADMSIQDGILGIKNRSRRTGGRYLPVDHFLSSLAEDQKSSAIGVVLSGTASDGTIGLKAIKAEGGITFAQDEASSKYHGMPSSAIAAGCVDFVLPPERIAKELARLAHHPFVGLPQLAKMPEMPPIGEDLFRRILHLLRTASGVDFTYYKPGTIRRRIARRMVLQKIENMRKYVSFLQSSRAELEALFQDILIHVTRFFREPEAFRTLQTKIFKKIVAGKKPGETIRVWVAGCSSGEEVYSLAIALIEFLGNRASSTPIQVFGTDISDQAIEAARTGSYPENALQDISQIRLRRFFTKTDGGFRVNKAIRDMCVFAKQDLTKDPPFSRLDLISCRNVLIYLGAALQKRIISSFHYALVDTGYLLLGKSEALTSYPDLFTLAERKARIYTKKPSNKTVPDFAAVTHEKLAHAVPAPDEPPVYDVLKEADRLIWQRFNHAGLVLNDDLDIVHFRGETSPYLAPSSGKASLHALRMVKEELKMELRSAIHKARRLNKPVRSAAVQMQRNGKSVEVRLEVSPLVRPGAKERHFLVLFDLSRDALEAPGETSVRKVPRGPQEHREIARLRRELDASREYLQSVVEQQEASNEELKSANEEILSSNEELQSTNEELETAKEELQSTNEELVTLNETLQNRNSELAQLGDDLNNVLAGVNIPIVLVGEDGRIRRYTPSSESLLNLRSGDIGRPIGNIRWNIEIPDLDGIIVQVGRTFTEIQREVKDKDGRWYLLRIRPYRTAENKIDGVLMAFVDVDDLKRGAEALRESEATVRALVETLDRAIVVIDRDGTIVMVNAGAEEMFGYQRGELLGHQLEVLLPEDLRQVHIAHRDRYFAAPQRRLMGAQFAARRENGTQFPVEVSLSYVQTANKLLAVASITDITDRLQAEADVAERDQALILGREQLQNLTASLLMAQEEERQRLASELHDDLNQRLAALAIQAGSLEELLPRSVDGGREKVHNLRRAAEGLSDDLRRIAHQLHPSVLEHFGLPAALRSFCEEVQRSKGLAITFRQRKVPNPIPDDVALCLYRVAQESLTNAAKHSAAKSISVLLAGVADDIYLAIKDDGNGFDASKAASKSGLGLIGMRERTRLNGGSLSIKTKPGNGCLVEARIPLLRNPK